MLLRAGKIVWSVRVHDLGSDLLGLLAYELDLQRVVLRNMRRCILSTISDLFVLGL
jgi:hypothetical protein